MYNFTKCSQTMRNRIRNTAIKARPSKKKKAALAGPTIPFLPASKRRGRGEEECLANLLIAGRAETASLGI
jgi:hypothetical protein